MDVSWVLLSLSSSIHFRYFLNFLIACCLINDINISPGHRAVEALRRTRDAEQKHLGSAGSQSFRPQHSHLGESPSNTEEAFCAATAAAGRGRGVARVQRE